jgi:hypothetical protein
MPWTCIITICALAAAALVSVLFDPGIRRDPAQDEDRERLPPAHGGMM